MFKIALPAARTFAIATVFGGLAIASPSLVLSAPMASSTNAPQQVNLSTQKASTAPAQTKSGKSATPQDMAERIEARIQTLHDKLQITPEQESDWKDVAEAMRENEVGIGDAIQERHQNAKTMSAVEDLESYQKIAQAHADGLRKVASAFQSVYDDMSDDQKKNADEVFGRFEGQRGVKPASATGKSAMSPATRKSQ